MTVKMNALYPILFIMLLFVNVHGQESFELTVSKPYHDFSFSTIEGNYYYSIGAFYDMSQDDVTSTGVILKYSYDGDLITKEIIKNDTSTELNLGVVPNDSLCLFYGCLNDTSKLNYLYVLGTTPDLNIVFEKLHYLIPDGYDYLTLYDIVINQDNNAVLVCHLDDYSSGQIQGLMLIELDMEGSLVNFNHFNNINFDAEKEADLIVKFDGTGYYYFNGGNYDWIEFNNDLEYVDGGYFLDPPHFFGGFISCKYKSNGNLMFVGLHSNLSVFYDLNLQIYDSGLQNIMDTILSEEGRQFPARYKGLDWIDEDNIWVVVHDGWVAPTGTEIYKVYLFDSDWNIKGSKYYGGDTQFDFNYVTATTDGGCIFTGTCNQEQGSTFQDIFILKVMPDDIITGNDEKVFSNFRDVLVYPNPVTDYLLLKTDRADLTFHLYNSTGQLVFKNTIQSKAINRFDLGFLTPGYYIYSITNSEGKSIDGGKLLKQ